SQLKAFMAGQVALAPLDGQVAGPIAAASPLPGAIEAADAEFRSLLERDGPAIAFHQWFADNGMTFGGDGALSIGPDMVAAQLEDAGLFRTWNMSPTHRGSSADSALAWVGGDLTITGRNPDNGISESRWNYLMFWERQPNGEYRILAAMTNLKPRNQAGG
ncbi:MAG TPA: hypothetical protein PLL69_07570, partial [Gemmatimonadales bacterium]|nr:hypothetical protein [Gemmatimonadales bacterium]